MKRNLIFSLLALVVAIFGSVLLVGAEIATISNHNGETQIELNRSKGSGYLILSVVSANRDETYWELILNYYEGGTIVLGEIPSGIQKARDGYSINVRQSIPEESSPSFPTNEPLLLLVTYRSDFFGIVPGSDTFELRFSLDASHRLDEAPNKAE
ncbi:MAG: hypothetical protein P1U86_00955 [Verrucomicrobiales bacterium]|nr:hypothetical protein [Verrucomicrobiales bacterium]